MQVRCIRGLARWGQVSMNKQERARLGRNRLSLGQIGSKLNVGYDRGREGNT